VWNPTGGTSPEKQGKSFCFFFSRKRRLFLLNTSSGYLCPPLFPPRLQCHTLLAQHLDFRLLEAVLGRHLVRVLAKPRRCAPCPARFATRAALPWKRGSSASSGRPISRLSRANCPSLPMPTKISQVRVGNLSYGAMSRNCPRPDCARSKRAIRMPTVQKSPVARSTTGVPSRTGP